MLEVTLQNFQSFLKSTVQSVEDSTEEMGTRFAKILDDTHAAILPHGFLEVCIVLLSALPIGSGRWHWQESPKRCSRPRVLCRRPHWIPTVVRL